MASAGLRIQESDTTSEILREQLEAQLQELQQQHAQLSAAKNTHDVLVWVQGLLASLHAQDMAIQAFINIAGRLEPSGAINTHSGCFVTKEFAKSPGTQYSASILLKPQGISLSSACPAMQCRYSLQLSKPGPIAQGLSSQDLPLGIVQPPQQVESATLSIFEFQAPHAVTYLQALASLHNPEVLKRFRALRSSTSSPMHQVAGVSIQAVPCLQRASSAFTSEIDATTLFQNNPSPAGLAAAEHSSEAPPRRSRWPPRHQSIFSVPVDGIGWASIVLDCAATAGCSFDAAVQSAGALHTQQEQTVQPSGCHVAPLPYPAPASSHKDAALDAAASDSRLWQVLCTKVQVSLVPSSEPWARGSGSHATRCANAILQGILASLAGQWGGTLSASQAPAIRVLGPA